MKKKLLSACALLCAGAMCLPFAACSGDKKAEAAAYVSMDINPSIEFTLDKDNKVISVYGANEDGKVLLYGEDGIIGLNVEVAVEKVTKLAVELGYLDESNKVVETTVTAKKGSDELLGKLNAKIEATASALNLSVTVSGAEAYSLMRKYDELKKDYPALTVEKLKLALSASENGEITVEAALKLSDEELIKMISAAHEKVEGYATVAYNKAKSAANVVYEKAASAALDGIYASYYTVKHPLGLYNAVAYQGYKAAARGLDALSDALVYAEKVSEYEIPAATALEIAKIFGLENTDALKNSDGKVTVASVEGYADKLFKNSAASEELERIKTELTASLETAETAIRAEIAKISETYADEIEAIKSSFDGAADLLKPFAGVIQPMIDDFKEISGEIYAILSDGKITAEETRALAVKLDKKSNDALKVMEGELTKEEKNEIKDRQAKAENGLKTAKDKYDAALKKAEDEARARLAAMKAARTAD